mmetsp:Transcript_72579/g.170084  ORF Transcript_72579/g.170084 Transcript_72579/m.170084 type:complete len:208 (-) Transcript_72579:177-800(-)
MRLELSRLSRLVETVQDKDFRLALVECWEGLANELEKELHDTLLWCRIAQHLTLCSHNQLQQDVLLQLEATLVEGVGEHADHILQNQKVVLLEERHVDRARAREETLQELGENLQAAVGYLWLLVLHGPDQGVNEEDELCFWQEEQCLEAVCIDGLQQIVELHPVVGIALEVSLDHVARALEHHLKDPPDFLCYGFMYPGGQDCQQV